MQRDSSAIIRRMQRSWACTFTKVTLKGFWIAVVLPLFISVALAQPSASSVQVSKKLSIWPKTLSCPVGTSQRVEVNVTLESLNTGLETEVRSEEICDISIGIEPFSTGLRNDAYHENSFRVVTGFLSGEMGIDEHIFTDDQSANFVFGPLGARLSFDIFSNYWPVEPFSKAQQNQQHAIIITLLGKRADPRLSELNQWFDLIGVGQLFTSNWLCDFDLPLSESCENAAEEAFWIGFSRLHPGTDSFVEMWTKPTPPNLLKNISDPGWRRENLIPHVVFRVNATTDRFRVENFENTFLAKYKTSFWDLALAKAAFAANIPETDVVIDYSAYCSSDIVFLDKIGTRTNSGEECDSVSFDTTIPASVSSVPGLALVSMKSNSLQRILGALLTQQFSRTGAQWTYLEQTNEFAEILVRNLRGFVIHGGRYWELLRLNFFYAPDGNDNVLRLIAEGSVAASLGGYPPDSQFTESMDVNYSGDLNEFAHCIVDRMRALAVGEKSDDGLCNR